MEIKAVERLVPEHEAQLLTYLRMSGCQVGLLSNFNALRLQDVCGACRREPPCAGFARLRRGGNIGQQNVERAQHRRDPAPTFRNQQARRSAA